MLMFL
jgi:ankyrin repeat protein